MIGRQRSGVSPCLSSLQNLHLYGDGEQFLPPSPRVNRYRSRWSDQTCECGRHTHPQRARTVGCQPLTKQKSIASSACNYLWLPRFSSPHRRQDQEQERAGVQVACEYSGEHSEIGVSSQFICTGLNPALRLDSQETADV